MKKINQIPRMFEEVSKQIINYINDENLQIGDKLPTERKLSELLEVSRSSIREGLRILELLQFIESRQGDGTFVSVPPPFMIPKEMIKQNLDLKSLNKYFEVAKLHAEQIISSSWNRGHKVSPFDHNKNVWDVFHLFINELGNKVENDYHLALWNNIFRMLKEQQYFEGLKTDISSEDLVHAINEQDSSMINVFLLIKQSDLHD
ncbi:FadR/GntR family transcriptional regulator [Bacillus sp. PS06]|uniref:FadR/GntR family transcriptional regulator n=1 Tax=Bacillus sp. PS06 TaxID=2764176 RepID=UPI0017866E87|nr:GntR family transcriptional regulator [Bacillus sp. PS06]MBD8067939.1 FadR family transcriptional regulator [Bacillus sp. PS06]